MSMRDVVIVGAGPAGLHLAARLGAAGLDVTVLEAQARVGERVVCSGVIGEEAFQRFDLPTETVCSTFRRIQAVSPRGAVLDYSAELPLARVVHKADFNRALAARAESAGAEIATGRRVESFAIERDGVTVGLRLLPDNRREELRARFAVLAVGVGNAFSQSLGLCRPAEYLQGVQVDVDLPDASPDEPTRVFVGRSVAPGGFAWSIPLEPGRWRLGLMTTDGPLPYFQRFLERVAPSLDPAALKPSHKPIGQLPRGRTVAERLLAVGEAAGHVKTSTGGGIFYGLLGAELAAETIARAFRTGSFAAHTLAEYERGWRRAFGKELQVGHSARKMGACLRDSHIERIFNVVQSSDLLARVNGRLRFDWHQAALLAMMRNLISVPGLFRETR